mgnify:CR=1 FL=1
MINTNEVLKKYGLRLTKTLGQNFLTDINIIKKIVAAGEVCPSDLVVEIGPGIGSMTAEIAAWAADKPGLIFIHGTGSHTLGAFGELPGSRSWEKLVDQFEGRLFGFEHPTFSESPIDNALAPKALAAEVLDASIEALAELPVWSHDEIQAKLRSVLVDGLGVKPKFAFGPLRVGVTGSRVSPPLFESLEILGKASTLERLRRLRNQL